MIYLHCIFVRNMRFVCLIVITHFLTLEIKLMGKIIKYLLLFGLLLSLNKTVFAEDVSYPNENTNGEVLTTNDPGPKSGHSIKAYSSGTIYKEITSTPPPKKKIDNSFNEDDPGFPGDPGQGLPVGDGFFMLLGAGIIYFLNSKNHFKKK